jgi:Flp pilus assembly CpaF family ATPase
VRILRTALGPAIAAWLEDVSVIEVMFYPDGRIWIDRLTDGLADTGEWLAATDGELPETGERFEGLLPLIVAAPAFAIRKPARLGALIVHVALDLGAAPMRAIVPKS